VSESEAYALAAVGVIALWAIALALYLPDAGLDPARIPFVGPVLEHTWDAIVGAARKMLGVRH
jgi:hypothetical protein